jgi:hypothetical protein
LKGIQDDYAKPRSHLGFATKLRQVLEGPHERFLDNVLRFIPIPRNTLCNPQQLLPAILSHLHKCSKRSVGGGLTKRYLPRYSSGGDLIIAIPVDLSLPFVTLVCRPLVQIDPRQASI